MFRVQERKLWKPRAAPASSPLASPHGPNAREQCMEGLQEDPES